MVEEKVCILVPIKTNNKRLPGKTFKKLKGKPLYSYLFNTLKKMFEPLGFRTVKTAAFYEETPYCDLENDVRKVMADYKLYKEGRREEMGTSPAFWGNMLSMIFKKTTG